MPTDPISPGGAPRKFGIATGSLAWWLALVGRVAVGAVFVYAAYSKLRDSWVIFAMSVDTYHMLPEWGVEFVARALPWIELIVGVMLILGLWVRWAAVASTAMAAVFFCANLHAYFMGMTMDCGCFGAGVQLNRRTILLLDAALVAVSLAVAILAFIARRRARQSA
ncbi:MAG: MauE/DoxX family redox-associated membrane protein [Candidatus Acidiferrales bacterium]